MRHVAFANDAMRSDTMITNDNDCKLILFVKKMFDGERGIAPFPILSPTFVWTESTCY